MTKLSLGYSTCPNDTLAFYALSHGKIDAGGIEYDIQLADVEKLNQRAGQGLLDVTKLSFAAMGSLLDRYGLLRSGAALGRGCGPLVVARPGVGLDALEKRPVAVPGLGTTAAMLVSLYAAPRRMVAMGFDSIMPRLQKGEMDIGVIIHEGRFTYREYGLECLMDLGDWWESKTGMPIPLGCIAARRDLSRETVARVEAAIGASVRYGLDHRQEAMAYISRHAQEMAPNVINQHIDLYVNEFTVDLGDEGERAVQTLFQMARDKGLIQKNETPLFAT